MSNLWKASINISFFLHIQETILNRIEKNRKLKTQQTRDARSESRRWQSVLGDEMAGDLVKFNQLKVIKGGDWSLDIKYNVLYRDTCTMVLYNGFSCQVQLNQYFEEKEQWYLKKKIYIYTLATFQVVGNPLMLNEWFVSVVS